MAVSVWRKLRLVQRLTPKASGLPWWGLGLTTEDVSTIRALQQSATRLTALLQHEGWADVELVMQDWLARYHQVAERLGQTIKPDDHGRVLVSDEDTPQDDRRRLIACAQAAALRGLAAELRQRAQFTHTWARQRERARAQREEASESLV